MGHIENPESTLLRVLYDEHAAALWRYSVRLTGDRARAEDVVQETLLRAWQHPEVTADSERSARAWLFTVARNLIIDDQRSARSRREKVSLDAVDERAGADEVNTALDRLLIGDAMASLSPEHRAVIRRAYYLGWTTAQIAADLDIPEGTVKSRLHYAVRALRLTLQEMGVTRCYADPFEMWDAAYVLGSLSRTERREYEVHLRDCRRCSGAVAELSGMPALLALLDGDTGGDLGDLGDGRPVGDVQDPPPLRPGVFDDLLARVAVRRRRSRGIAWALAAAAAAVLLVLGTLGGFDGWGRHSGDPAVSPVAAVAMASVTPSALSATLTLTPRAWGTDIGMTCTYGAEPAGTDHDAGHEVGDQVAMVAVGRDGSQARLATWIARAGVTARPSASTALPLDQIAAVQVVSVDTGDVLLEKAR